MVRRSQLIQKNEVMGKLLKHISEIKGFWVEKIGLFGSLLKGDSTGDVDILIAFRKTEESFQNLMDLFFFLEDLLNFKIDLVTTNALSPYIVPYILREVEYIEAWYWIFETH